MVDVEDRIFEVALEAAHKAGELMKARDSLHLKVDWTGKHDVKLEVDVLCEKAILETITRAFPDHAILAEESGVVEAEGPYRWIIDPLDGTVNYYVGLPYYCTSIACFATPKKGALGGTLEALGRPVAGVVYAPCTGDLFTGRAAQGATLNGRPLRVPEIKNLKDAVMGLGFGKSDALGRLMAEKTVLFADKVRKIRCMGAAAFDMANVSCGRLNAFFEKGLRTWDMAAASVILKEAGALLDAEEYEPTRWRILASAPGIYPEVKALLG